MASSSSSSSGCWKYDAFLSFRGEDTRKTFVDHLYSALEQHGILTYKDDVTLDRGDTIGPALLSAIQESQIALVVFSEKYADSSWCLDELSYIMKCNEERGQIVMPIFYNVDPSDVRKQTGQFGEAFAEQVRKQKRKYEEAFAKDERSENNKNKLVESWKKALVDASNIAGWEPKHVANGHEAKCIREIVDSILVKLQLSLESAAEDEDIVGMGTRLKDLKRVLRIGSGGVRMVGIWGLGGGGKTTLATSIYMQISANFGGSCFVENIREQSKQQNGLKSLQEKILSAVFDKKMQVESVDIGKRRTNKGMLCRRNVLIVLDDVDDLEQLEALAGRHDWFGDGSRIIITTRNEQVLISHRVDEVYPVSLLSDDEAIRLFRRHAYHADKPVQDYEKLSLRVISYVNGLPLALKVLGGFLYGKDKDEWMSALDKLKHIPNSKVTDQLKISYDGLDRNEKELFLDIACFHCRQYSKDYVMEILDACGFYPHIGVKVLIQKSLISVSKNGVFDMHDLVQEMAHYIVRGEHPYNPEKHSRLWRGKDVEDMCSRNATAENDKIEAIQYFADVCSSDFIMLVSNMKKLRFLFVRNWNMRTYGEGPSFLSNELRCIDWRGYPASPFPESFQPTKLAVLNMHSSLQKELWKGCKHLRCLKGLELSEMRALARTPDFGGLPCLQKLRLYECESLEEIHESLGNHASLVSVKVWKCNKLTRFPSIVGMEKLEILRISYCEALAEFPRIEAKMDNLVELSLYKVGIKVLPSSVGEYCTNLNSLELKSVKKFELSGCRQSEKLPKDLFNENLDEHRLLLNFESSSSIKQIIHSHFPRSLRKLNLGWCEFQDGEIPTEIVELSNLQELRLDGNDFTRLDFSLSRLTRLKLLVLSYCKNLVELPELPSSLAILEAFDCESLEDVIRDEIHTNCKWLSQVLISGGEKNKNIIGGERLLETMLQGNAVESRCMIHKVDGLEIARGFEPRLVKGDRCRLQLPENWFNDFSGFLFCAASDHYILEDETVISMKHSVDDDDDDDDDDEDDDDDDDYDDDDDDAADERKRTWVGYIPFSLLRHTSWWDPTSTAISTEMKIDSHTIITITYGLKLVPKRGGAESSSSGHMETTHSSSSSSEISLDDDDDHYKCKLRIQHDSKSALECSFDTFVR